MNTNTHSKRHQLDPARIVPLAALSAVGAVNRNPGPANLDMTAASTYESAFANGMVDSMECRS